MLILNGCLRKRRAEQLEGPAMGNGGLLGSSAIYLFAFMCLGIGTVASDSFRNYVRAITQVIRGFIDTFGVAGLGILEFATKATDDLFKSDLRPVVEFAFQPFQSIRGEAIQLREGVRQTIDDARDVFDGVDKAITVVHAILIIVFIVLFLGLVLLFSSGVRGRMRRRFAKAVYLLPLLLSWIMVGIVTSTGAVLGDVCVTVADYQKSVLVENGQLDDAMMNGVDMSNNPMTNTQLTCPDKLVPNFDVERLKTASQQVEKGLKEAVEMTGQGLDASTQPIGQPVGESFRVFLEQLIPKERNMIESSLKDILEASQWINRKMDSFISCTSLEELLARINVYLCGRRQTIMVVFAIWLSLLLLAILLSIMLLLASFTRFNPAFFLTPRWVATKRGTYLAANKKLMISPSEFSPYFEGASAPAPAAFVPVDENDADEEAVKV